MLYIMRHGRTDWNDRHKLQGSTDIPLNENGRAMAEKAREEYRDIPLDECWCSPLIRARETAEIVLRDRGIPIRIDERLREMGFGTYEGTEKTGTLSKFQDVNENKLVTVEFKLQASQVIVHHIIEGTSEDYETQIISGNVGDEYRTNPITIANYELVRNTLNVNGKE